MALGSMVLGSMVLRSVALGSMVLGSMVLRSVALGSMVLGSMVLRSVAREKARASVGIVCVLALLLGGEVGRAAEPNESDSALKVPRFVSLHSDKVNLRTGPGRQYPIDWVLTRKDMPVEVIAQFEHWRRVREWDGTVGWVQEHMVAGKRYAVIAKGGIRALNREPDGASPVAATAEPGVVARLVECRGPWCRIEADDVAGWIRRNDLWGVYPDESVP